MLIIHQQQHYYKYQNHKMSYIQGQRTFMSNNPYQGRYYQYQKVNMIGPTSNVAPMSIYPNNASMQPINQNYYNPQNSGYYGKQNYYPQQQMTGGYPGQQMPIQADQYQDKFYNAYNPNYGYGNTRQMQQNQECCDNCYRPMNPKSMITDSNIINAALQKNFNNSSNFSNTPSSNNFVPFSSFNNPQMNSGNPQPMIEKVANMIPVNSAQQVQNTNMVPPPTQFALVTEQPVQLPTYNPYANSQPTKYTSDHLYGTSMINSGATKRSFMHPTGQIPRYSYYTPATNTHYR